MNNPLNITHLCIRDLYVDAPDDYQEGMFDVLALGQDGRVYYSEGIWESQAEAEIALRELAQSLDFEEDDRATQSGHISWKTIQEILQ